MTEFDSFWAAYPRKVTKGDARKAWRQTERIRPPVAELVAAIEAYKAGKPSWQSFKHPATWLRGECWEDDWSPVAGDGQQQAKPDHMNDAWDQALGQYGDTIDLVPDRVLQ